MQYYEDIVKKRNSCRGFSDRKVGDDELVEITPNDIRVRKKYLTIIDRRRHARELGKLEDEDAD